MSHTIIKSNNKTEDVFETRCDWSYDRRKAIWCLTRRRWHVRDSNENVDVENYKPVRVTSLVNATHMPLQRCTYFIRQSQAPDVSNVRL